MESKKRLQKIKRPVLLGYVYLNDQTKIPQRIKEIRLLTPVGGPINTDIMKPFRAWRSPIVAVEGGDAHDAVLQAYQRLLEAALQLTARAKGSFVMYVSQELDKSHQHLLGAVYKL